MRMLFRGFVALLVSLSAAACYAAPPAKILNNFVTELASLENVQSGQTVDFTNPRDGWILIAARSGDIVKASFSRPEKMASETLVFQRDAAKSSSEAMKYLPAGNYAIRVTAPSDGTIEKLAIRAIPAIFYDAYRRFTRLHECNAVARDWEYLEKYVNPNINTFVVHRGNWKGYPAKLKPSEEIFNEWAKRGKHWVDETPICFDAKTVDEAYEHFLEMFTPSKSKYNGYLVDEFCERPERAEMNRINIEALQRIVNHPDFAGKKIYPYIVTTCPKFSDYDQVWRFVLENRSMLAQEWYIRDMQPEMDLLDRFNPAWHTNNIKQWNEKCPGAAGSLIMTLGGWNLPNCSGNLDPRLNCKVSLDRQMHFLSNHPAYAGLGGINLWTTSYMDEELIRWMCRLFRHYCIEGNKDRLSNDPYVLPHLVNPDFEQGAEGWTLQAAEPDSIRAGQLDNYGIIQGRYAYRTKMGEHFLVTRRSEKDPNIIRQTVKNLTPGRLYTFRMYTADFGDLKTGKSKRQLHDVSITLEGVEIIPGKKLQLPYSCSGSTDYPPFDSTKTPCWLNYHWILFRAKSETVELTISDWGNPKKPGKISQETVFNFFKVEPYYESREP